MPRILPVICTLVLSVLASCAGNTGQRDAKAKRMEPSVDPSTLDIDELDDLTLPAESLAGQHVALPKDLPDQSVLLVLGFTKASRVQTTAWSRRVAEDVRLSEAIATYQAVFIEDVPSLLRGIVTGSIRGSVPRTLHKRFLIVTENTETWKKLVSYSQPDAAYLLLLDPMRRVVWRGDGEVADDSYQALHRAAVKIQERP